MIVSTSKTHLIGKKGILSYPFVHQRVHSCTLNWQSARVVRILSVFPNMRVGTDPLNLSLQTGRIVPQMTAIPSDRIACVVRL